MEIIPMLIKELESEAQTTRKMLALMPDDKYDWKPHQKSMPMGNLALHVAELPTWVSLAIHTSELDFATSPYTLPDIKTNAALLEFHEKNVAAAKTDLEKINEEELVKTWTLRNGEIVYQVLKKVEMIRVAYSQIVHHRAQLGVYLRLLDIPIPGSYGPSADEQSMM
ncbi:MAG: DinB family protein [Bacteroidetes bacterium]|nr:DinB family protein [Bacteroidota bacterium]